MYNYLTYSWPVQDLSAICALQNTSGAGNLLLNGTYSILTNPSINFFSLGFVPDVSFSSVNDLSSAIFTITGVQNNMPLIVVINGPNNNTVTTTEFFDIVTSISVNQAVNGIRVGTGLSGYHPLFPIPTAGANTFARNSSFSPYAFQFNTQSVNGVTYSIYESVGNVFNNGETYKSLLTNGFLIQRGPSYTTANFSIQLSDVCSNILIGISAANSTSSLKTQFLQL